jgi:TonB family protein
VALHAAFLLYSGRPRPQHFEHRIEVALVDLKAMPAPQTVRSIPRPYRRSTTTIQNQKVKIPDRPRPPVTPAFSNTLARPLQKVARPLQKVVRPQAVGENYLPLSATAAAAAVFAAAAAVDNAALAVDAAVVAAYDDDEVDRAFGGTVLPGQIKAVALPRIPIRSAGVAYTHVDQTLVYQGIIHRYIEEHKRFPPLAIKMGWEGNVGVRFTIHRDGQVEQVKVTRSSRVALLDKAGVDAIKNGNPFPPFPKSITADSLLFEVTVSFEFRKGG